MQILGGIRQTTPGWKSISFDPTFLGDLLECTVPTPLGPIQSSWKRHEEKYDVELRQPEGITATRTTRFQSNL